jgi:RimJ/RimL family protein N-acetyltransferase
MIKRREITKDEYIGNYRYLYSSDSLKYDDPNRPIRNLEEEKIWWDHDVMTKNYLIWAMINDQNEICGIISLFDLNNEKCECEMGINVFRYENYNRGYGSTAINIMLSTIAKSIGMKHIRAETNVKNHAAIRILNKNGFIENGQYDEGNTSWMILKCTIA